MYNLSDTIAAICTPPGTGAIAAIRVSGPDSWKIVNKIFTKNTQCLAVGTEHCFIHMEAVHGYIIDTENVIDEVIVLPYKSPHSFTTEDSVEIFCHGGSKVVSIILELCLKYGARIAAGGEFTFRAFVNGRIDLTTAEAINEIINADNLPSVYNASTNLVGSLKEKIKIFREKVFNLLTAIESHLEFPLEVPQLERNQIVNELSSVWNEMDYLINTSNQGQILRAGIKISILGVPNVGKSSLLNQLLESERAIVTDEPGTTRDTVIEKTVIGDLPFVLVDTAGIRDDIKLSKAEKSGIERSRNSINDSDIVLVIFDLTKGLCEGTKKILELLDGKPRIVIGNKLDLCKEDINKLYKCDVFVSAKYGNNIDSLRNLITGEAQNIVKNTNGHHQPYGISINQRQRELLLQSNQSIQNAMNGALENIPEDLIVGELKDSLSKLDEVSGRKINDEIIAGIFAKFCIGK